MAILRRLFGPSRNEVWQQLAAEIGADTTGGGFWSGTKVQAHVDQWTVTLDTYAVSTGKAVIVFTRMRAPYVNADGLRFTIYRRGWFSGLAERLGAQDIEIGEPEFDRDFVIKGTDPGKVQQLFANTRIRELIQAQPTIHLEVKNDEGWFGATFPEGTDELCFHVTGVIKDIERLKLLFDLFAETLHHLCHIGSAYDSDPEVRLS